MSRWPYGTGPAVPRRRSRRAPRRASAPVAGRRSGTARRPADRDPAELTVRAICAQAGLGVRYFYESFTDKDDFVGAVFDSVIADIAATTQAAVASAPPDEQARAGMANVVRAISADPRVGRLLFSVELSNTVIVRKRAESTALFAALLFAARRGAWGAGERPRQGRITFRGRRGGPDDQCVAVRRSQPRPRRTG